MRPRRALLGDKNADLISTYIAIKEDWRSLESLLFEHDDRHDELYYYRIRQRKFDDRIRQAARLIYLNRTCFNGIYRVNLDGEFNVPIGTKDSVVLDSDDFQGIAQLLSGADLRTADFEDLIDDAGQGDLIFADPPYTVRHNYNGFVKYNETLFSWEDQERLAEALTRARGRGAKVVSTNANHESIRELYEGRQFVLKTVSRFSPISADPTSRTQFEELVILSV